MRLFRRQCLLIASLVAAGAPARARAADAGVPEIGLASLGAGYSAGDAELGAPTELEIALRGEVAARCRMTSAPVLAGRLDLNQGGAARATFGLDCNTPFVIRVRSAEGGLAARTALEGVAARVAYEVGMTIDTDAGTATLGWCRADQLGDDKGGCVFGSGGWSSGDATAINGSGALGIRWAAPAEAAAPPLGDYRDTVVIDMAVRS